MAKGWDKTSGGGDVVPEPAPDTSGLQAQIALLQEQLQTLMEERKGTPEMGGLEAMFERMTRISAEAHERAAQPSNREHPGKSVFSYPEGDLANPRPPLRTRMFWADYEITEDTTTAEELELLNQMEPGTYHFRRTDGSTDTLYVRGEFDATGGVTRLMFSFQVVERRETLPPMVNMLRDALGKLSPAEEELAILRAEVAALKGETPMASAVG